MLSAACRAAGPRALLPAPGAAPADTTCLIGGGSATARDTLTVALAEPVDPTHAPIPRNDAERLVFAQLYETLIRVDCQGRVLPGLAASWEPGAGGRWIFTLREDARFWDGAPVTARDVLVAWRPRDAALAQTVTILGDRTFGVQVPATPFQPLADRTLAVTKPAPGGPWPIGTGSHWVTSAAGPPDVLWLVPLAVVARPVLKVATVPAGGARDALDERADLLVTSDPAALEYAGARPEYTDVPLEWDRTYVLLAPGRDDPGVSDFRLESLRQALHVDARPAERPADGHFWFTRLEQCELPTPTPRETIGSAARRRRVVYDQADRSAADLAARLVGLGALGKGAVAAGLPPPAFRSALRVGGETAYVLDIRRRVWDVCRAARELPPWSATGIIEPLLDVRSHAVVRRRLPRFVLDWDGTLRLAPP